MAQTAILHFDLDAFHASVQKLLDPSLRINPAAWCRGAPDGPPGVLKDVRRRPKARFGTW